MNEAVKARNAADRFEARLVGYSKQQRKDGDWIEVKFHVHPSDLTPEIINAPLGQKFMVVAVPFEAAPKDVAEKPEKRKRTWDEIPPAEQAGIRCEDEAFQEWTFRRDDYHITAPLTAEVTADWVRWYLDIQSRSHLSTNTVAAAKWRKLDQDFMARHMTEQRS